MYAGLQLNQANFNRFAAGSSGGLAFSVATIAALIALTTRPLVVVVEGFHTAGDGGGGTFWWDDGSSTTAVVGMVVSPTSGAAGRYKRMYTGPVDPRWCGAYGTAVPLGNSALTITSGTTALTVAGGIFSSGDVGKTIIVPFAGVANAELKTTIAGVTNATHITLGTAASSTLSARVGTCPYGWDDTAAIQAALDFSTNVKFSDGNYLTTARLQGQAACTVTAANKERTLLIRAGGFGSTIRVGVPGTTAAASCSISNLYFYMPQEPVDGTTTVLPFTATAGSAHIEIYGGQLWDVTNCIFAYMPYSVLAAGCNAGVIANCRDIGVWDPSTVGLQEGIAGFWFKHDATFGACKLNKVIHCPHIGGAPYGTTKNVTYTSTCGVSAPVSVTSGIGRFNGVKVDDSEGLEIFDNYFGGSSGPSIALNSAGSILEVNIDDNFFDGAPYDGPAIKMVTSSVYAFKCIISNNIATGGNVGLSFLHVDVPSVAVAALDLTIVGNTASGYVGCGVRLEGATGVKFGVNQWRHYNCLNICATDPLYAAGVYVGTQASKISFVGDSFGGGTGYETASPPNYCSWGIYGASANLYAADAIIDNGCLTALFGGSLTNKVSNYQNVNAISAVIAALTATTINGNTWTAGTGTLTIAAGKTLTANRTLTLAGGSDGKTLTINKSLTLDGTDGKTLTLSNSLAFAGTDSTTMTFPATSTTVAGLSIAQTFSVIQQINLNASAITAFAGDTLHLGQADGTANALTVHGFGGTPFIQGVRANGTFASPTVPVLNSILFQVAGRGYVSGAAGAEASYSAGRATMSFLATETWSSTALGTKIVFGVTSDTTTTRVDSLQIDTAGVKVIGSKQFWLGANATTGLVAGALAATTNASIVIYDASGQSYRVPCII